jgi:hypothetical protein
MAVAYPSRLKGQFMLAFNKISLPIWKQQNKRKDSNRIHMDTQKDLFDEIKQKSRGSEFF